MPVWARGPHEVAWKERRTRNSSRAGAYYTGLKPCPLSRTVESSVTRSDHCEGRGAGQHDDRRCATVGVRVDIRDVVMRYWLLYEAERKAGNNDRIPALGRFLCEAFQRTVTRMICAPNK